MYAKPVTERVIRNNISAITASFGFTKRMELGVTQILYQDVNYNLQDPNETYQLIGYTQVQVKSANYYFKMWNKTFFYGFVASVTRQGKFYNIYLEPYYDAGTAGEIDGLISYYWNPFYPEESPALHFNLGYVNYNDAKNIFSSGQAFPLSLAFVKANLKTEYSAELHGNFFARKPYESAYSRENYLYLCPGFKYKIYMGLAIATSLDIRLYSEDEKSVNFYSRGFEEKDPQYPAWNLNLKLEFAPSTAFYEIPTFEEVSKTTVAKETLRARRVVTDKKSLFEWVVDENKGAEYIDLELEKIRAERKQAEAELEKLKQEIEAKSSQTGK
jgi:hypothetical protein